MAGDLNIQFSVASNVNVQVIGFFCPFFFYITDDTNIRNFIEFFILWRCIIEFFILADDANIFVIGIFLFYGG